MLQPIPKRPPHPQISRHETTAYPMRIDAPQSIAAKPCVTALYFWLIEP